MPYREPVLRVGWVVARALAVVGAVGTAVWLVGFTPATGARRAVLFLGFLVFVGVVALWICEAHELAATRPKRIVSALAASAVAAGLLAAVMAIPNVGPAENVTETAGTSSALSPTPVGPTLVSPSPPLVARSSKGLPGYSQSPPAVVISTDTAFDFFTQGYFPAALRDPRRALKDYGTEKFQNQKKQSGLTSYFSFYRTTLSIPSDQVRVERHDGSPDSFDVRFLRVLRSGTTAQIATLYVIRCADSPLEDPYGCTSSELRVDSSASLR